MENSRHLPLLTAKLEIKRIFKQSFHNAASLDDDKSWDVLRGSYCALDSPRAAALVMFRVLIGHDFLSAYLFRFNIISSHICVLCDSGQAMNSVHLYECSSLNNFKRRSSKSIGTCRNEPSEPHSRPKYARHSAVSILRLHVQLRNTEVWRTVDNRPVEKSWMKLPLRMNFPTISYSPFCEYSNWCELL
ncbi:uncharacterized protein NPIL_495421 [Nephila pilipes]|uniref:Uncharacterized protein n=1 Tax=Nephila pilipes TaxID=299642 RepID=A0A8X6UF51_NEPPI|nr:uncharacterized protein NPIL_495421 [Nephila pilipes]